MLIIVVSRLISTKVKYEVKSFGPSSKWIYNLNKPTTTLNNISLPYPTALYEPYHGLSCRRFHPMCMCHTFLNTVRLDSLEPFHSPPVVILNPKPVPPCNHYHHPLEGQDRDGSNTVAASVVSTPLCTNDSYQLVERKAIVSIGTAVHRGDGGGVFEYGDPHTADRPELKFVPGGVGGLYVQVYRYTTVPVIIPPLSSMLCQLGPQFESTI